MVTVVPVINVEALKPRLESKKPDLVLKSNQNNTSSLTMKIKVTDEHIDKGRRGSRSCSIALAIKDVLKEPDYKYISVGKETMHGLKLTDTEGDTNWFINIRANLPQSAIDFIKAFDNEIEYIYLAKNPLNAENKELQDKAKQVREIIKSFEFELVINEQRD